MDAATTRQSLNLEEAKEVFAIAIQQYFNSQPGPSTQSTTTTTNNNNS